MWDFLLKLRVCMDKITNFSFWKVWRSDIRNLMSHLYVFLYSFIVCCSVWVWSSEVLWFVPVLYSFLSHWVITSGNIQSPIACRMADDRPGCVGLVGSSEPIFSGLYSYHVPTNTWKKLCDDVDGPSTPGVAGLISRVGHTMLFHPVSLFILLELPSVIFFLCWLLLTYTQF